MIKMMVLAPRRDGMSHSEFRDYLVKIHAPLVLSVTEVAAGLRGYHYNFPILGAHDGGLGHDVAKPFDIFMQAWFDSIQSHKDNMSQKRYLEIIRPDEERFADNSRAIFLYMNEIKIIPGSGDKKVFYLRRRRPDLSQAEFQTQWRDRLSAALEGSDIFHSVVHGYIQNHAVALNEQPQNDAAKVFDVIDEFAIDGPEAWAALNTDKKLCSRIAAIEADLLDTRYTQAFFTETVRNIDPPD